jgi:hypothetical protein
MVFPLLLVGLLIVSVWLGFLTFYLRRLMTNYNTLTDGVNRKNLDTVLSNIIKRIQEQKKDLADLSARCDTIEKNQLFAIQKIGLLRFNPFKDTGGDQSFILSLVDAKNTGVVITALYSRSGTRWYAKKIAHGKGVEHELSEEEKKALLLASKQHDSSQLTLNS